MQLWFPVNLSAADGALAMQLSCPEASLEHKEVRIEQPDLQAAYLWG
jgi:hypothetical protein